MFDDRFLGRLLFPNARQLGKLHLIAHIRDRV